MKIRTVCLVLLWLVSGGVRAHEIRPAIATVQFERDHYRIEFVINAEALLAGIGPQHKDTRDAPSAQFYDTLRRLSPGELRGKFLEFAPQFTRGIELTFDGKAIHPRIEDVNVPEVGDLALSRRTVITLAGAVPTGAETVSWRYDPRFGTSVVRFRQAGTDRASASWLQPGVASEPFPLQGALPVVSRSQVVSQYLGLGFTHIVPKGLDHILFVLGLFLLSTRWRPLLWQVTAFTLAHTITLGLTIYGVISLSPKIVEPLIALSIVYVAVENIFIGTLRPWRILVVFCFGLLHGMGFAGVLSELGLPRSEFLTALLSFNAGVELGQLTVIGSAFLLVGIWGSGKHWYRTRIVVPASAIVAAAGLFWTIQRVMQGFMT